MYHCGMRQIEERHVANQIDLMVWSNKLDLIGVSNLKGEVQIHRLQWQKVWSLAPPKEDITVQAMAWRPDGKALAIGYSSGSVYVVDVEDKEILSKCVLERESSDGFENKQFGITCITWAVRTGTLESATEYNIYNDSSKFLQRPPNLSSGYKNPNCEDSIKDFKEMQNQTQLNMLLVGYGTGYIYMTIFGRYKYGTLHLSQVSKDECGEYKVLDIVLSDDFSVMQILYLDRSTNNLFMSLVNTSVLSAYSEEIFEVANKHGQIVQFMSYLDHTMVSMTEAWEHILLEMDTKMAYYADIVPEGGVSADLLELLMMGVASNELEIFLLQDLTTKGLKKFGNSVELSYSTIQKLVLRQLNIVGQSLTYHLSELRGLARIPDRYKIFGLDETTITEAIRACCAFLNKCLELQQVIDVSMRNYKAFFRWLFVVIVRLLDEQTPSEIVKITQQDLTHIAEFLYNFDNVQVESNDQTEKPVKFNLERLGQYLQNQNLRILPDEEDSPWQKFLKENPCLIKDNDVIFSMAEFRKFSLIQQQNFLKSSVGKVFDVTDKDVSKHFNVVYNIKCHEPKTSLENNLRVSQLFDETQHRFMMAFLTPSISNDCLYFVSSNIKDRTCNAAATKLYLTKDLIEEITGELNMEHINILDLQFYSAEYLSMLIQHPHSSDSAVFIQLPLKIALDNCNEFNIRTKSCIFTERTLSRNISPFLDQKVYKVLDKMDGFHIAVSGRRKVAVVLSKSLRKVRVFEMEVDDEDEEETIDSLSHSHNVTDSSQGVFEN